MKDNEKHLKSTVANFANRSEKTSWTRKRKNLETYVKENIAPIEQELITLKAALQPLYDYIDQLRQDMIKSCIHPVEDLRVKDDGTVHCNFCSKTFKIPNGE